MPLLCKAAPQTLPKAFKALQYCHRLSQLLPPAETSQGLVQTQGCCEPWDSGDPKAAPAQESRTWQPSTSSQKRRFGLHLPQHEAQTIGLSPANTRHKGQNVPRGLRCPGLAVVPSSRCHTGVGVAIRARPGLIWRLFIHSLQ